MPSTLAPVHSLSGRGCRAHHSGGNGQRLAAVDFLSPRHSERQCRGAAFAIKIILEELRGKEGPTRNERSDHTVPSPRANGNAASEDELAQALRDDND